MAVPVSVIIATYNWSEALRISIASALAQTYRDFELLVIGDCCTDDSAEVALSFEDSRIQWHNLPIRGKSQSGPNNHGNTIATGDLIAYLGHDDVWHPDHLKSLVLKMEQTGADIACCVTVMYGPPESGMRGLSGIFVEGRYRREDFFPPSSMMHQRSLTSRIGPWKHPEQIADPVDCDLLRRAYDAGARFVSTDQLTVFKFNSAWRRDSYVHRDASEQRHMLDRLKLNAAQCVEEEWAGLLRAMREKRLIETRMPDDSRVTPGQYHRANLRSRGLLNDEVLPLVGTRRFSMDDQAAAMEWHAIENHADYSFRWSGPASSSMLVLPVSVPARFRLQLQVLNWLRVDVASEVTLMVGDRPVAFQCNGSGKPVLRLEAMVSGPEEHTGPLRVQIKVTRLRCPFFESGGESPDQRWLGVCVNWIELEPLP